MKLILLPVLLLLSSLACTKDPVDPGGGGDTDTLTGPRIYTLDEFVMGADLSYVNQIMDVGGHYAENENPYVLFADHGCNLVRLRLWHSPNWFRTINNDENYPLYNNLPDVIRAAKAVKEAGMGWCLDIHYSDNWADPGKQYTPESWLGLDLETLKDSVYEYTKAVMSRLNEESLWPDYVQIGNEINTGILHPVGHYEENNWQNLGALLQAGIQAVRDQQNANSQPKIILHVANPEHVRWFFRNVTVGGGVTDFDVIGVSYYPAWSDISPTALKGYLKTARDEFDKDVMLMETAYPWIADGADNYTNLFGAAQAVSGYPYSRENQLEIMKQITQSVIGAGGIGVVYWEPAFISTSMKTQWGTGSPWENCTFFDFTDNNSTLPGIDYMTWRYTFE